MKFNSYIDVVLFVIEIIACLSFATSGAIKAIRKKTDFLGILILTLIEVFGGGLLRDMIIGQGIPHIFYDPEYLILAAIVIAITIFWFLIAYFKKTAWFIDKHRHDFWIYALDAIGIAVFCVCGVRTADAAIDTSTVLTRDNVVGMYVYLIILGVITGVGGGMFRDIFCNEIPMVFKKHFYMTPCIIGTTVFAIMYELLGKDYQILSISVSILIIVALRILATIFKWNMPFAKGYDEISTSDESK